MDTIKCYGRKNTVCIKREKSFITNFFDGNKSSQLSLFDDGFDSQYVQERQLFFEQDKENFASNVLQSPVLFQNSYHTDFSVENSTIEQTKPKKKKRLKSQFVNNKPKKAGQNPRKKKAQNDFKLPADYVQPRWSEFNQYDLTVEGFGKRKKYSKALQPVIGNKILSCDKNKKTGDNLINATNVEKTPRSSGNNIGIIDFHNSLSTARSPILGNFLASRQETFYSSGELFTESWYKSSSTKKKKVSENPGNYIPRHSKESILKQMQTHNLEKKIHASLNVQEFIENHSDVFDNSKDLFSGAETGSNSSDLSITDDKQGMEKCQNMNKNISKSKSISSNVSHMFRYSNSIPETSGKIVTSTPVVRLKRIPAIDLLGVSSTSKGKSPNCSAIHSINVVDFESVIPDRFCVESVNPNGNGVEFVNPNENGVESVNKDSIGVESVNEDVIGVESVNEDVIGVMSFKRKSIENTDIAILNDSIATDIRKSLQPDFSILCSPKSYTVQNEIRKLSHAERSRSLLNKSTSNFSPGIQNTEYSDEVSKKNLLELCNQESVIPFADAYDWSKSKIKKIGEGTYGEVFLISKAKSSSVIKIIPMSEESEGDSFQCLKNVLAEVKISKCLSDLRNNKYNQTKNFIKLNRVSLVSGSYPLELISAWDSFSEAKSTYNDRPDTYGDKQLFVILDLEYGGKDMSCIVLKNANEAESVLKQIAATLAVAEEEFLFEHRDLHLGNILIRRNRSKYITFKIRGHDITFESYGLHATIIDFTLSRLYESGYIYYNDLANDVSLFNQSGDFQFEVYRCMKDKLENQWHECSLYSNVLWLNFICVKLKDFKYSHTSSKIHKKGLKSIEAFKDKLSNCRCALDCLKSCGITTVNFESDPDRGSKTSKNSILISRNSFQKSKLSICN